MHNRTKSQIFTKFIGKLEVKSQEQPHMLLGEFTSSFPAKGFLIQIEPDPDSTDSIVTQIIKLGTENHYNLILHIANYGDKTVYAEVWQM